VKNGPEPLDICGSNRSLRGLFLMHVISQAKTLLIFGSIDGSRSPGVGFSNLKIFQTRVLIFWEKVGIRD